MFRLTAVSGNGETVWSHRLEPGAYADSAYRIAYRERRAERTLQTGGAPSSDPTLADPGIYPIAHLEPAAYRQLGLWSSRSQ